MTLELVDLRGTTDGSGDAVITAAVPKYGRLIAVEWVDGDLADGNTAVLACTGSPSGVVSTLHTQVAGEGNSDVWYYPRAAVHDLSAVGLTYDGTRVVAEAPVVNGYLKLTIASGGAANTGGAIVYVEV